MLLNTSSIRSKPAFFLNLSVILIGTSVLIPQCQPFYAILFFTPFTFGPLIASMLIATRTTSPVAQTTLSIGAILYAYWFGYVYMSAFHWHPDPQSVIALLFVGFYSIPIMAIVWIIALLKK